MENTAKNFALQLGSLVALYVSVGALITLLFGLVTLAVPDAADSYWLKENSAESIRFSIAMLFVFFPTYLYLTRMVNTIRRKEQGAYLTLTKWLIYLSLLVAGAVILGDLVAVILAFLNGDIALRFILKALIILVVVGAAFEYYLLDAKGYWQKNEQKSIQFAGGVTLVVIVSLVAGFFFIETPGEVREARIDQQQVQDLQDMQWRIEEQYRLNGSLPENIADIYEGAGEAPTASEEREDYVYRTVSETSFELCAEFKTEQQEESFYNRPSLAEKGVIINPNNWDHGTGEKCFKREISALE